MIIKVGKTKLPSVVSCTTCFPKYFGDPLRHNIATIEIKTFGIFFSSHENTMEMVVLLSIQSDVWMAGCLPEVMVGFLTTI